MPNSIIPTVNPDDFKAAKAFGPEAIVPPFLQRYIGRNGTDIDSATLVQHFQKLRELALSDSFKERFSEEDCARLISELLGNSEFINTTSALEFLRARASTSEIRLLIRTIAIYSFDQLSASQTSRINPLQHYNDLHVLDREILPHPRRSGGSGFVIYTLASDDLGCTRLHIYPTAENGGVSKEGDLHEHTPDSSSIILTGQLLNRHYKVTVSDHNNGVALYQHRVEKESDGTNTRHFTRVGYVQGTELVSNHTYVAGDYYHLPGPLKRERQPCNLLPEMELTYHTVANRELTATLFCQMNNPNNNFDHTTMKNGDRGPSFTSKAKKFLIDPEPCYQLLVQADESIRESLASVDKVRSGTIADRIRRFSADEKSR